MAFCPVCGAPGPEISTRCERVARFYGYSRADLDKLAELNSSIAVPFLDIKRFFFALESLAQHPLATEMLLAIESNAAPPPPNEFGNAVRIIPFHSAAFPGYQELYVKEDVSKTMVVYQHEEAIEHLGSEERAVLFAELATRFFGREDLVPASVCGLTQAGAKFVASAGVSKQTFASLQELQDPDVLGLWHQGVVPQAALVDLVLGQNDRNSQNVLLSRDGSLGTIRLIDNDDAFVTHERLVAPFAYLHRLVSVPDLHFGTVRTWFDHFSLASLVSRLTPFALPEATLSALCRRFAFARHATVSSMPLETFIDQVFVERPPVSWRLPGCPWTVCRTVVKEEQGSTSYRTFVGEGVGHGFVVHRIEGKQLDMHVQISQPCSVSRPDEAMAVMDSLINDAAAEGFVHIIRRRFFVATPDVTDRLSLRVVDVRSDASGFHVVVKRGSLDRYGSRQVDKFISFASLEHALAAADSLEAELLRAHFVDLRARLEAFKAPRPATFFA